MSGWDAAEGRLLPGAEYYAGIGWRVFPTFGIVGGKCECGKVHPEPKDAGKHPNGGLARRGHDDATVDLEQIRRWWGSSPEANIGVACQASGFIVVDVDPRNDGLDSWVTLEEVTEGALPDTVEAETGQYGTRGGVERGRHLFFKVGEGESFHGNLKSQGMKGIDIKHKGYVLISPSRHASGVCYDWRPGHAPWEIEMAEAPEELLRVVRRRPPRAAGAAEATGFGVFEWDGEKIDVDALLTDGIYQGERVVTIYKVACSMANTMEVKRAPVAAALKIMMRGINAKHVFPPLDENELDFQVQRAIDFVVENPLSERIAGRIEPEMLAWAKGARETSVESKAAVMPPVLSGGGGGGVEPPPVVAPLVPPVAVPSDPDAVVEAEGGLVGRRSMTDLGNGRRIVDYAGATIRHTSGVGWHVWNGAYWVPDATEGRVQEIAKKLPVWIGSELLELGEDDPRAEALIKWAHSSRSISTRRNAVADARTDSRIQVPVEMWDSNPHMIGVKNGVINLRTGDLLTNDPELYITRQSRVAYTAGMTNVRWTEFLDFATGGDKELARYLQLAAGYTLTGDRHHECLFLIYGPPGSGKSTFLEVLGTLLGDYYLPMDSDVLVETVGTKSSTEYHMAQIMGRRMIGISEWPEGRATKEDAIKRLTGDTQITGRHPGERPFSFESQAKIWVGTNIKPRISERAMWRRIRAINFSHVPEKPDPDLKGYLLDPDGALPAVLAWAVQGAVALLGSRDRSPLGPAACGHVMKATREYEISEDKFGMFMAEELKMAPGMDMSVMDVFNLYERWVAARGEREPKFYTVVRILEEKGFELTGSGNKVRLNGWTVVPKVVGSPVATPGWGSLVDSSRLT